MAFHCVTASDYLQRTTNLLSPASDSTVMCWVKFGALGLTTFPLAYANLDNPAVYAQFISIDTATAGNSLELFGTGSWSVSSGTNSVVDTWYHVTWVQSGTTQRFYVNGSLIGSHTLNRAAYTVGFEMLGNDSISDAGSYVAFCREWQTALTANQILAEMTSSAAVHTTNLFMDCPLATNLLDTSGNGRDWTLVGSSSFVANPGNTNSSIASATTITSLPYSTTQSISFPLFDACYTYTATEDATIDVFGFGDLTNYQPYDFVMSPSTTFYLTLSDNPVANVPLQFPVVDGTTYWFKFTPSVFGTTSGTLTVSAETAPVESIPYGAILVNDDAAGFSAAVLSSVDGDNNHVYQFVKDIAQGDGGDILSTSHKILLADAADGTMVQYSGDLSSVLTTLTFGAGTGGQKVLIRANQTTQNYYAGQRNFSNNPVFQKITAAGVMTTFATLSSHGLTAFAVSDDESTIFLSGNTTITTSTVKRWSVGGAAFIADLVASVANHRVTDMLLMTDSTLLVMYIQTFSPGDIYIKRYNSTTGATLNTYTLETGITIPGVNIGYRLAFAIDDPASFWVWYHVSDGGALAAGVSRFKNVRVSDGVILASNEQVEFENGVYQASPAAVPIARFGPSSSCPFIILREVVVVPAEPVEYLIRRERWFPHIGQEQLRQFFSKLQIDLYAGNGISTGQGSDPLLEIDWSDDGGHTWSDIHFVQTGAIGAFRTRAILRRMGSSRDRVFRIACSDPVQWSIINGYLDATLGTS